MQQLWISVCVNTIGSIIQGVFQGSTAFMQSIKYEWILHVQVTNNVQVTGFSSAKKDDMRGLERLL